MLNLYTYLGYSTINLIIAIITISKSKKNITNYFYLLSIIYLVVFGGFGVFYEIVNLQQYHSIVQHVMNFIYALFPFIFLHFIINFVGYTHLIKNKISIPFIYLTGLFSYLMIATGIIDGPFLSTVGIVSSGSIFYITWMSIYFAIGVVQLLAFFGGKSDNGVKSNILFSGFLFLLLILPGPFSESLFEAILGDYNYWYFISSIIALIAAVYIVFRHKTSVNLLEALKSAISVMDDIIIQTDENMKIIQAQGALGKFFGCKENEFKNKYLTKYLLDNSTLKEYINLSNFEKSNTAKFDLTIESNDNVLYVNFSITPLFFNETITGYILIGRDISDRKKLEQKLLLMNQNLEAQVTERTEELSKLNNTLQEDIKRRIIVEEQLKEKTIELNESLSSKDKMFSIVAHDLKNPFTSLIGLSEVLMMDIDIIEKDEIKELASNIHVSSTRVFSLLENLLQWAKIQTNRLIVLPVNFSLIEVINHVIPLYNDMISRKQINLKIEVREEILVYADKFMIETVIRNLISNAIKFSQNKNHIIVKSEIKNSFVEISVIDNGVGISEKKLNQLFKIDEYVSTPDTEKQRGSGIGLILCKEFIAKNGGEINVVSKEDKGSTFTFKVPISV